MNDILFVMKYKLLAVDADGTLLNDKGQISPRTLAALQKAKSRGILIVLCTGRGFYKATEAVRELNFEIPLVLHNGALIVNSKSGKIISQNPLPVRSARESVKLLKEFGLFPIAYELRSDGYKLVYEQVDITNQAYVRYLSGKDQMIEQAPNLSSYLKRDPVQLVAIDLKAKVELAASQLREKIKGINVVLSGSISFDGYWFLEVLNENASKAKAIEFIGMKHRISSMEMIAIGDNFNDLDMIRFAGLGVAMENAHHEVKSQAQYVTSSNLEDGVAEVIEKFVLKEKHNYV